jgi:hypothetical protein
MYRRIGMLLVAILIVGSLAAGLPQGHEALHRTHSPGHAQHFQVPIAHGQGTWAFEETFDGTPSSPQPFSSPRLQLVVGENNQDGIVDGQEDGGGSGVIEAGHGPNCGPPVGTGANNHNLHVDFNLLGFQQNTRPHLAYICNAHLMTAVKSGYGVVSFMPRQLFDWAGRTGTYEFETSLFTFGREWWDTYIVPEAEMLWEIVHLNEGGTGEQLPRRGVRFSLVGNVPSVALIDNYQIVHEFRHWQQYRQAFPNDPALSDPTIRRTVRMRLSQTGWGYEIEKQDGSYWSFSGTLPQALSFTRGLVRTEHHAYNPTKDGITGTPWSQYTHHWDNVRFDGPIVPARPAFQPGPHFVDLYQPPGAVSGPVTIQVPLGAGQIQNPVLMGHMASNLQRDEVDPQNTTHWRQVRVNGGTWQDIALVKNVGCGGCDRSWSTFRVALSGVVPGANTVEFRYPLRPPQATWHRDGFRVKDIELQVDPVGGVLPTSTPPTAISAATRTPTMGATATRTPTPISTPTAVCNPRPSVSVSTVPGAANTLLVTLTAGGTPASGPRLQQLQIGAATNALIDIPLVNLTNISGNQNVTLPLETRTVTFTVRRAAAGSTTVPLTVVDTCGNWPTLVGGGASAF